MANNRGFFSKLFDFSFSDFIAIQIVGILYILGIIFAGLAALGIIIAGFSQSFFAGIISIIVSPIVFLLYVVLFRLGLEAFIASIRTAENTRKIVEHIRKSPESF